jgi:hypothetical protein
MAQELGHSVKASPTQESVKLLEKLTRVAQGLVGTRQMVEKMKNPPLFLPSALITAYAPIKTDLDEFDVYFKKLRTAMQRSNVDEASRIADGLLNRLYGAKGKNAHDTESSNAGSEGARGGGTDIAV